MNGILTNSSEARANNINNTKQTESVETAGSLAMNQFHSLFETKVYDMFTSSNPFAVDYSQYSESGNTVAYTGGFLSSFSNAVSTLSSGSISSTSASSGSFASASCGGFSGASCSSSGGGGFSSVC